MAPEWQVAIGIGVGGLLVEIFRSYRQYVRISKDDNEHQKLAKWSIIIGILGIISLGLGSIVGIILGFISMKNKKNKALSRIGIIVSILTLIPYILVLVLGP